MRKHQVPFDLKFEDKIFGGMLSIRQVIWLIIPVVTGFVILSNLAQTAMSSDITVETKTLIAIWAVVRILVFTIIALLMAFLKRHDMTFDRYCLKMLLFSVRRKEFKNYQ